MWKADKMSKCHLAFIYSLRTVITQILSAEKTAKRARGDPQPKALEPEPRLARDPLYPGLSSSPPYITVTL